MNKKKGFVYLATLSLSFFLILSLYNNFPQITVFMHREKLLPEEEHFTELYFEEPLSLPVDIKQKSPKEFAFTVHNLEGRDMDYLYRVYFMANSEKASITEQKKKQLQLQSTHIENGKYLTKRIAFTRNDIGVEAGQIVVELPEQKQEIYFLINNK